MRLSLSWLKEHLAFDLTANQDFLTFDRLRT